MAENKKPGFFQRLFGGQPAQVVVGIAQRPLIADALGQGHGLFTGQSGAVRFGAYQVEADPGQRIGPQGIVGGRGQRCAKVGHQRGILAVRQQDPKQEKCGKDPAHGKAKRPPEGDLFQRTGRDSNPRPPP